MHQGLAALGDDDEQFAEHARYAPGVRKQDLEDGVFPVGRTAPEHRHRHQLHILFRMLFQPVQQSHHLLGLFVRSHLAEPALLAQKHQGVAQVESVQRQAVGGAGQAQVLAFLIHHQIIGEGFVLQHVNDRPAGIQVQGGGGIGRRPHPGAHHQKQEFTEQPGKQQIKS